tara:strand:- start:52 stop:228 length:177 start_codon:yes stop_codon:yes gene_type:complete
MFVSPLLLMREEITLRSGLCRVGNGLVRKIGAVLGVRFAHSLDRTYQSFMGSDGEVLL